MNTRSVMRISDAFVMGPVHLPRYTISPWERSYGESAMVTRSPSRTFIRYLDIRPDSFVSMLLPSSVSTWYIPPEWTFTTVPSILTLSSLLTCVVLHSSPRKNTSACLRSVGELYTATSVIPLPASCQNPLAGSRMDTRSKVDGAAFKGRLPHRLFGRAQDLRVCQPQWSPCR